MRQRYACFGFASCVGIACLASCSTANEPFRAQAQPDRRAATPQPSGHVDSPPPLLGDRSVANPQSSTPAPTPSAAQTLCPCPPDPPGSAPPTPPDPTPAPSSSAERVWCTCPGIPQPPRPRPLSTNVPDRACRKDRECGKGFCDRGRCAPLWIGYPEYGQTCEASAPADACRGFLCLEGRCRSCVSDAECPKQALGDTCDRFGVPEFPGRNCGQWVSSGLPAFSLPPQPKAP
jgi:hypothetical protein